MTKINLVINSDAECCGKPEKEMKLTVNGNRVALNTSDGFVMFSINLKEKKIYFEDMKEYLSDQIAEPSGFNDGYYYIKDRC